MKTIAFNTAVGARWVAQCPECAFTATRPSRGNAARELQEHLHIKHGQRPAWSLIVDEMTEAAEAKSSGAKSW